MPEICTCGNELSDEPKGLRINRIPCRCKKPAGPRQGAYRGIPNHIFESTYTERTKLGLPLETPSEKSYRR